MRTINRTMILERAKLDSGSRTVPATLSSTAPALRDYGQEVLLHTQDAIDMSRAANGLPLLFSHDREAIIGRVEGIRIDGDKLRGLLRFSDNTKASEVWADVEAGILTDISIGYQVIDMEPAPDSDVWNVTRWLPLECSVVTVPADPSVGINRSSPNRNAKEFSTMKTSIEEIREIVKTGGFDNQLSEKVVLDCVTRNLSSREAARLVYNMKFYMSPKEVEIISGCNEYGLRSESAPMMSTLMAEALAARCGGVAPSEAAREFVRMTPVEMARSLLDARGVRTKQLSAGEVISRAMTTTSDFPQLLASSGNRILQNAYQSYKGGLKRICRQSSIVDFRAKQVLNLGEAPSLELVNEHGEFSYGAPIESKLSYSLQTFGRIFAITRQALINDDLNAFGGMVAKFGVAAAEREAVQLVSLLTSNPTMSDGVALFHANHGNLAASGGAISVATLGAARKAMRLQTGLDGVTSIDCSPSFLIVPAALETVAEQFLATLSPTMSTEVNPFSGRLELVVDPRLDAKSATAWYLAADPGVIDTIEYAYLEGYSGPVIEARDGWEVDGTEFKARLDFGAGVLGHRGLYKNAGA